MKYLQQLLPDANLNHLEFELFNELLDVHYNGKLITAFEIHENRYLMDWKDEEQTEMEVKGYIHALKNLDGFKHLWQCVDCGGSGCLEHESDNGTMQPAISYSHCECEGVKIKWNNLDVEFI